MARRLSAPPRSTPLNHPARPKPAPYAVVLAAGAGSRFGGDKLLTLFQGRPLIAHTAGTVAEAILSGLLAGGVAVIPPRATSLMWPLETAGLRLVENPDAAAGLGSSLKVGLAAVGQLDPGAEAAMVVLADQPMLRMSIIALLVEEWRRRRLSVRPRYSETPDRPGHPVLLDRGAWPYAKGLAGDSGLGALFKSQPHLLASIDVPGDNPDVDTPSDLHSLEDNR